MATPIDRVGCRSSGRDRIHISAVVYQDDICCYSRSYTISKKFPKTAIKPIRMQVGVVRGLNF